MVAIGPAVRAAMKYGPVAVEAARRLDRQLRPHVLAYSLAESVDGVIGRWTAGDKTHWVVFPTPDAAPLRAFPPLPESELQLVDREIDRQQLRHHSALPEARVRNTTDRLARAPGQVAGRLRRGDAER